MSFKKLENKKIPDYEADILSFWKDNKIFEKSVENRSKDNLYVFYDGPPFISGLPHYGHLLGSIAKDVIPRFFTMKGKRVERVWGWDAHGLTVENRVQKELGIKNRRDIEEYGLEKFIKACYEYTSDTSAEWPWYIDRIGRWVDMENAYKTIDQPYMESVIWAFKKLYDKGLIYEGVYTSLYCPRCGTPVSNFEIAMDNTYREEEDPAVTIKFKITSKGKFEGINILAWTTTPWTLSSNRALVVDKKEDYSLVESNSEMFIVAKKRLEAVFEASSYTVKEDFKGKDLLGLDYEPLYKYYKSGKNDYKIYHYDGMVHMEEGTGIVHSAPGFGEIDTTMGRDEDLTMTLALDDEGKMVPGTEEESPYAGIFYKKTDPLVIADLKERNLLFKLVPIVHRFPYHDRCNTNLVHRAQNSWFVDIKKLRKDLLKNNEDINWVPEHLKEGRFHKGIEQAPQWCISRARFWATPMPVWKSVDGDIVVIGSVEELEELSGQKVKDLHRPYIDDITFEKNGKKYTRIPEVLDSWFEAGSMPYAQIHYPFENEQKFEENFPGDYIVEYVGQVRAWFYVMHVLSSALFGKNSFRNVISTGTLAGNDGRKMSKTYNNYTDPKQLLNSLGGDALRLYLMNSPLMIGDGTNIDDETLKTKSRNVLNPLINSLKFFLIYATQHDWDPKDQGESTHVLDMWIKARLNETIKEFSENLEGYLVPPAAQALEDFVDDLSRWYVRRSRDRISAGNNEALSTFYEVLVTLSKLAAPLIPFMSETIYQSLVTSLGNKDASENPMSVHLCDYPEFDKKILKKGKELIENMRSDRELVSKVLALRVEESLPIRQPLTSFTAGVKVHYEDVVKPEVNVKKVLLDESLGEDVSLDTNITEELELERIQREIIRGIQSLRKKEGLQVSDITKESTYPDTELNKKAVAKYGEIIKETVGTALLTPGESYAITKKD